MTPSLSSSSSKALGEGGGGGSGKVSLGFVVFIKATRSLFFVPATTLTPRKINL